MFKIQLNCTSSRIQSQQKKKTFWFSKIRYICSKIYGSRISLNVVKATVNGIANSATVAKVARLRGKSVKELLEK